jgi:hypothetical protein
MSNLDKDKYRSPGPGMYDTKDDFSRHKSPSVNIGVGTKRSDFIIKENRPGPGGYDAKINKGGPSYTIGGKPKNKMRDAQPGPGNYDPKDDLTKAK